MNKLLGLGRFEQVVRKSRFIAVCGAIEDAQAAAEFVHTHGQNDCKHVCWAFRAGDEYRFDDAGEPSGTAGRPILAAIDQFELDFTMIVVNRYFGGVKLGTGGLARAFSSSATGAIENAIEQSGLEPVVEMIGLDVSLGFEFEAAVHRLIHQHQGQQDATEYDTEGVRLKLRLSNRHLDDFRTALNEITRGQVSIAPLND